MLVFREQKFIQDYILKIKKEQLITFIKDKACFLPHITKDKKLSDDLIQMAEIYRGNSLKQMSFPCFVFEEMKDVFSFFIENLRVFNKKFENGSLLNEDKIAALYYALISAYKWNKYQYNFDGDILWTKFFLIPEDVKFNTNDLKLLINEEIDSFVWKQNNDTMEFVSLLRKFIKNINEIKKEYVFEEKTNLLIDDWLKKHLSLDTNVSLKNSDIRYHENQIIIKTTDLPLFRYQPEMIKISRNKKFLTHIFSILEERTANYLLKNSLSNIIIQKEEKFFIFVLKNEASIVDREELFKEIFDTLLKIEEHRKREVLDILLRQYSEENINSEKPKLLTKIINNHLFVKDLKLVIDEINKEDRASHLSRILLNGHNQEKVRGKI